MQREQENAERQEIYEKKEKLRPELNNSQNTEEIRKKNDTKTSRLKQKNGKKKR